MTSRHLPDCQQGRDDGGGRSLVFYILDTHQRADLCDTTCAHLLQRLLGYERSYHLKRACEVCRAEIDHQRAEDMTGRETMVSFSYQSSMRCHRMAHLITCRPGSHIHSTSEVRKRQLSQALQRVGRGVTFGVSDERVISGLTMGNVANLREWSSRLHEGSPEETLCITIVGHHLQHDGHTGCTSSPSVAQVREYFDDFGVE